MVVAVSHSKMVVSMSVITGTAKNTARALYLTQTLPSTKAFSVMA
jgi:hypothetical protein